MKKPKYKIGDIVVIEIKSEENKEFNQGIIEKAAILSYSIMGGFEWEYFVNTQNEDEDFDNKWYSEKKILMKL